MIHRGLILVVSLIACAGISCSTDKATDARIRSLEETVAQLKSDVGTLQFSDELEKTLGPVPKEAVVDPTEKGFSIATSRNGHFLVACDDATPYLDGYRIHLRVGNVHDIVYKGFNLSCKYGARSPEMPASDPGATSLATTQAQREWREAYARWENSLKTKYVSFTDELKPGTWNRVELVLAPVNPGELGYLGITVETNEVSLRTQ
jgi:hypothetical protein